KATFSEGGLLLSQRHEILLNKCDQFGKTDSFCLPLTCLQLSGLVILFPVRVSIRKVEWKI
ncbi:hypothetical protein, partial [Klebsiella sp. HMSC09D12]|uniref:hypothetical protein n=1 Tax=Klebsiella sp. HMSC09D12 TaxID=1581146 RepID=UPI001C2F9095